MTRDTERDRVRERLQRAAVAMLVTTDGGGTHAGRPMLPLWVRGDSHMYFLTHQDSRKVTQIAEHPQVVLTVVGADCYFVVLGTAHASRDPALIRRLWHPSYRAWFPAGKDDREALALRVAIQTVNYWEPARSPFLRLFQAVRAILTRRAVETPMKTIAGF